MNDEVLRNQLVELLKGGQAHVTFEDALAGLDAGLRGKAAPGAHSVWEELEHMRIAQEDILRYTLTVDWTSPAWPQGYWPQAGRQPTEQDWQSAVAGFMADLEEVVHLASNPAFDLTSEIPHGEGRTYLRQLLLVADHNAYHLGNIVSIRRALGAWRS